MATYRRRAGQIATGQKKKNVVLDLSCVEDLLAELEAMGGSVDKAVKDALGQAADTVLDDMKDAVVKSKMPAGGKYWSGQTAESIVTDTAVRKNGTEYWIPVGFDFDKPGAGGFLIVGTPWVEPVRELYLMFQAKKYMRNLQEDVWDVVADYLEEARKRA